MLRPKDVKDMNNKELIKELNTMHSRLFDENKVQSIEDEDEVTLNAWSRFSALGSELRKRDFVIKEMVVLEIKPYKQYLEDKIWPINSSE